jgi:hypothetical protein
VHGPATVADRHYKAAQGPHCSGAL